MAREALGRLLVPGWGLGRRTSGSRLIIQAEKRNVQTSTKNARPIWLFSSQPSPGTLPIHTDTQASRAKSSEANGNVP